MGRVAVPYGWKRLYEREDGKFVGIGWYYQYKGGNYTQKVVLDEEIAKFSSVELGLWSFRK